MSVLWDTDASKIASALVSARRAAGSPTTGMVMTLILVVPAADAEEAVHAAQTAAREHPSRILAVVIESRRGTSRIDAEVRSGTGAYGELALIRLHGEVAKHADSVVLPLLLPDSPVVVWWPTDAPRDPAADPLGTMANRRITDAAQVAKGRSTAMLAQCETYQPGNTDLAWTRITDWRAMLAAAMDQATSDVSEITVTAERVSPSADLLGAWLADRLEAPVTRKRGPGPGITEVRLSGKGGDIKISRANGRLATLTVPGQPDRPVALRRRALPELLVEELRRLDADDLYGATVRRLAQMQSAATSKKSSSGRSSSGSGRSKKSSSGRGKKKSS